MTNPTELVAPSEEMVDRMATAIGDRYQTYGQVGDLRARRPDHALLVAMARAALSVILPEGWQTIETAPKRIEFRCLLAHRFSVVTGYWDGDGWKNERSRSGSYFDATHWMPLPAAPISAATSGKEGGW